MHIIVLVNQRCLHLQRNLNAFALSSMASTSTEDTQTLTLPSTSAHSSVSTTIIPQPEKSLAYFHQCLPLEVTPINPTHPSFTSSSQAVSSTHVSQSY